jgi:hypothetical protein
MTENSASLGVRPRAGPPRSVSTSHGGVSTTFQSCQRLAMGAVFAAIKAEALNISHTHPGALESLGTKLPNLMAGLGEPARAVVAQPLAPPKSHEEYSQKAPSRA